MKIKTNRFLDEVIKRAAKQSPGVGHYKNLEKALDKRASIPSTLKAKRH